MSGTIGNRPAGYRSDAPRAVAEAASDKAPLGDRVLAALATWVHEDGNVIEPTTGDVAARLLIRAQSYERDELNSVLSALRQRALLRYEHDPALGGQIRWRLTKQGWELARRLRTGVTGFERSTDQRADDRFAKVRAKLAAED